MFKIYDGREQFYQWDINRKLIIEDSSITQVHFCNRMDDCSLVCEVYKEDGKNLVNVPNILLQTDWRINVYAYDGNYTKHSEVFLVVARTMPADYVYTETQVLTFNDLVARVDEAMAQADSSSMYAQIMGEGAYNAKLMADEAAEYATTKTDEAIARCDEAIAEVLGSLEVIENGSY